MFKRLLLLSFAVLLAAFAMAAPATAGTAVPGHDPVKFPQRIDQDGNGIADEGLKVNGHYYSVYAYDASGDWYHDLGDGRVQGTVGSIDDLDPLTLTTCKYVINYRAAFENDPFMDSGAIHNNILCKGYERGSFTSLIVHESDPRYTGNPAWSIWGTWEFQKDTWPHWGNVLRFTRLEYPV